MGFYNFCLEASHFSFLESHTIVRLKIVRHVIIIYSEFTLPKTNYDYRYIELFRATLHKK